jgi:AcrR family transcriptional regulator/predicted DNA-binding transcriptional regulator AlpA
MTARSLTAVPMTGPPRTLTIAEVVALTGVPRATIHSYLRRGLLPRPRRASPARFAYDERHVRALQLIRSLRESRQVPLPTIKRILPELLALEPTEAFLPDMWDRALAARAEDRTRDPAARLLSVAREAFARRGYGEVNVDELCRAARIAKGSFYRHYRSKEELFLKVAEATADEVAARFRNERNESESPAETLARVLAPRLPIFLDLFSRALQGKPDYAATLERLLQALAADLGEAVDPDGLGPGQSGLSILGRAVTRLLAAPGAFDRPSGQSENRMHAGRPGSHFS